MNAEKRKIRGHSVSFLVYRGANGFFGTGFCPVSMSCELHAPAKQTYKEAAASYVATLNAHLKQEHGK